jgi:hypothetical protein
MPIALDAITGLSLVVDLLGGARALRPLLGPETKERAPMLP